MIAQWLVLMMAGALTASAMAQGTVKEGDGTWVPFFMEQNGMKFDDETIKKLDLTLILNGDKYEVKSGKDVIEQGTAIVDKAKTPNTVDIKAIDGPHKDKTIPGLIELKGDVLTVCYNLEGNERPKEFATKAGSRLLVVRYKKK